MRATTIAKQQKSPLRALKGLRLTLQRKAPRKGAHVERIAMTYKLFLDDVRYPGEVTWVKFENGPYEIVRSYEQFVEHITTNGLPDYVCFDHDLNDIHYGGNYSDERTGYHAAVWLVEYCHENKLEFPNYVVHSMNPVGKENIEKYIEQAKVKYLLQD
jgi:hypothetical protein